MNYTIEKILEFDNIRQEQRRKIHKVKTNVLNYYIDYWNRHILDDPRELLYGYDEESGKYIGIDNTSNDCWVEEFDNEIDVLKWLGGNV